MTDHELLQAYTGRNSEDAFAELVTRYTGLVYCSALRQVGNPATAQEITQAVFTILACKASRFRGTEFLSGWLLRTTRFVALNTRRQESRRRQLEQQAMSVDISETEAAWRRLEPLLDEALFNLRARDRDAITLRFFEEKSFKEIANALHTSEDNAQKRVSRALERLRSRFKHRGVVLPAVLVSAAITGRTVRAAPAELSQLVAKTALLGPIEKGIATTLVGLSLRAIMVANIRRLVGRCAPVLLIIVSTGLAIMLLNRHQATDASSVVVRETNVPPTSLAFAATANPLPVLTAEPQLLRLHVIDAETQARISKARVTLVWAPNISTQITNIFTTDHDGTVSLPVERHAGRDWSYRIEVFRDAFVPKYVSWSDRQGDAPGDIPTDYTTKLDPAVNIGGVVVNEAGTPVPAARVVFDVYKPRAPAESLDRERLTMTSHYHVEMTDDQGRWHCSHAPPQFGMILFTVTHSNYAARRFGSASLSAITNQGEPFLASSDFRNGTALMQVAHGAVSAGSVVNDSGELVSGAKVTFDHQWAEPTANQTTGPDGRFQFNNIAKHAELDPENSICSLTVEADGYGPADFTFSGSAPPAEVTLTLSKGAELRGRVLDDNGNPVPKATVQVCSHSNVRQFEWVAFTDDQGRFQWLSAPSKPEFYVIGATGYQPMSEIKLIPDGTEHLITIHTNPAPIIISGTAVDASTDKPIEQFEVWMSFVEKIYTGYSHPMNSPRPARLRAVGRNGVFLFTNYVPLVSYAMEVRAQGYCAEEKNGHSPLTNDSRFEFRLDKASPMTGQVRLPDGTPLSAAVVMLLTERKGVYMKLPGEFDLTLSGATHAETDANGQFTFPPSKAARNIVVTAPQGFASVSPNQLLSSPIVTLQPWGCVMGTLKVGGLLASNETIDLSYMPSPAERTGYSLFLETKTDREGRFVFWGVPPWPLQLAHRLSLKGSQSGLIPQTLQTQVNVSSGQTNFVNLGEGGWKVIGQLKLPNSTPNRQVDWQRDIQTLSTKPAGLPPQPQRKSFASSADFQAAAQKWFEDQTVFLRSPAGLEAQRNQRRYTLVFDTNGVFKIDGVELGTYELKIRVSDPNKPLPHSLIPFYEPIGSLTKEIVIPEGSGPDGDPIDLGVLELEPQS